MAGGRVAVRRGLCPSGCLCTIMAALAFYQAAPVQIQLLVVSQALQTTLNGTPEANLLGSLRNPIRVSQNPNINLT